MKCFLLTEDDCSGSRNWIPFTADTVDEIANKAANLMAEVVNKTAVLASYGMVASRINKVYVASECGFRAMCMTDIYELIKTRMLAAAENQIMNGAYAQYVESQAKLDEMT